MKSYDQYSYRHLMNPSSPWAKTAKERADMTIACTDADNIPRIKTAGDSAEVNGVSTQVMHNGLHVIRNGYQGDWQAEIIKKLKGVHEPQEEKVFYEVLKRIDIGGTMIELGAWWAYYSMWFLKQVPKSTAFCTEPDPVNIELGKANMELNGFPVDKRAFFYAAASGSEDNKRIKFQNEDKSIISVPVRTVDGIVTERKLKNIDILHLDIQGFETEALYGAEKSIRDKKVRFIFVSTHHYSISGDPLIHQKTIDFITNRGGTIIASHNILESCSGDGLVVASFDERDKDFIVEVTPQHSGNSLFRSYEYDIDILWSLLEADQKLKAAQSEDINSLRNELAWKSDYITKVEADLSEIGHLSDHIKRQVKMKVQKIKGKNS